MLPTNLDVCILYSSRVAWFLLGIYHIFQNSPDYGQPILLVHLVSIYHAMMPYK